MKLLMAYLEQIGLGFDQFLNTLIPPLDGTVGMSDETLSARRCGCRVMVCPQVCRIEIMPV